MTARILTGSKREIAEQVASLNGEVREAIVFVEEPIDASTQPVPETVEELFKEMQPHESHATDADDSREAIYQRLEGE
jgi:hypothetical protein